MVVLFAALIAVLLLLGALYLLARLELADNKVLIRQLRSTQFPAYEHASLVDRFAEKAMQSFILTSGLKPDALKLDKDRIAIGSYQMATLMLRASGRGYGV